MHICAKISLKRPAVVLTAFAFLLLTASTGPVHAFSANFTASAVSDGNGYVEACRSQPNDQMQECVANALDRVANRLRQRPDYAEARDTFRSAASAVRSAASASAAASAVQSARSQLLSASGEAGEHFEQLADVMTTARSVLRS